MNFIVRKSFIHGVGAFPNKPINKNEKIDIAITYTYIFRPNITYFASFINHSYQPSCRLEYFNKVYYVVANYPINVYDEITLNYNTTPWYIENAKKHYI